MTEMNAQVLLDHFDRISDAPDAVPRLRRFILDLAVRGKLVEQDGGDGSGNALLRDIITIKNDLNAFGKGKKSKGCPNKYQELTMFDVPHSWAWTCLAEVGIISPRNVEDEKRLSAFIPMPLISADYGVECKQEDRPWGEIKSGYTHFSEGDVGLAKITPCFENGKSTVFRNLTNGFGAGTTELHIIRPVKVVADYILIFLKSPHFIQNGIPKMTGTAGQKRVPKDYFAFSPFPLPPLAEQHRIVAKVDELMALCDSLEAEQTKREDRRDRLVKASLFRVNQPPQPSETEDSGAAVEYEEHVRFHLTHLPRLSTKPEHVKELRQSILNLAVRGKLVEQSSSERLPEALSSIVKKERKDARVSARISGGVETIFNEEAEPILLPGSWKMSPLSEVALALVDCPHSTPKWTENGVICVRTNQFKPGFLDLSHSRYVNNDTYIDRIQRLRPQQDDILYSREGGILGVACRVPADVELCLGQRMMLIRASSICHHSFLELVLNSKLITSIAQKRTTGGAAPRINVSLIKSYPIPIPPLAEQHRIVAKVNKLMALCDELEQELTRSQDRSRRLLEAVLREALGHEKPVQVQPAKITEPTSPLEPMTKKEAAPQHAKMSISRKPSPARQNSAEAILAHMQLGQSYTRADILDALDLSVGAWNSAIRELKEQGKVVQAGERRGARYSLAASS